jgi:hypothetical protein
MKKLPVCVISLLISCFVFVLHTKAINVGSEFVECRTPVDFRGFASFDVTIKDDILIAVPYVRPSPFISKLSVREGVFEGIDYGEWGGAVRFSPYDMKLYTRRPYHCPLCQLLTEQCYCPLSKLQPIDRNVFEGDFEGVDYFEYKGMGIFAFSSRNDTSKFSIVNENCRGFFTIGSKNFVMTGLAHMAKNYGKIYELVVTRDNCTANKTIDIESEPETFLVVGDTAYIATRTSLLAFENNRLYKLCDIDKRLYPGSMVYSDGCLFIGMRAGFMCKYDLETKKSEWYQYRGKPL